MNFTAIDFETATGARNSICQIGIVIVENNEIIHKTSSLIQPPSNKYSIPNSNIHGITAKDTDKAPLFPEIWNEIKPYIENKLVVAHNASFDIDCLKQTLKLYNIEVPYFQTDCTYKKTGHTLNIACQAFNIKLDNHHDAEFDAIACASIYSKLINNIAPDYTKINTHAKNNNKSSNNISKGFSGHEKLTGDILKQDLENADSSNPFYDKKVVFTGVLEKHNREEAAIIVKNMGAKINTSISKLTDFVIAGGTPGAKKLIQIENLNQKGANIKILLEEEFIQMIK